MFAWAKFKNQWHLVLLHEAKRKENLNFLGPASQELSFSFSYSLPDSLGLAFQASGSLDQLGGACFADPTGLPAVFP